MDGILNVLRSVARRGLACSMVLAARGAALFTLLGSLALGGSASAAAQACADQRIYPQGAGIGGSYGWSLALEGELAAVGAYRATANPTYTPGAVYLHAPIAGVWTQVGRLIGSDAGNYSQFGYSVALSGDHLVAGTPHHSVPGQPQAGAAYVFERVQGVWTEAAKLLANVPQVGARFGQSVAVQGDTVVVGSHLTASVGGESGAAYVYERAGGSWTLTQVLGSPQQAAGDWLGYSLALDGEWLAAGAIGIDGPVINSGGAFLWRRGASGWQPFARLVPWDNGGLMWNVHAGWSIALSGNRFALGAHQANTAGTASGAIYVFEFDGATWSPLVKLVAPDATTSTSFGVSISMREGLLLAGAWGNADGVSGSGSAYLFEETAGGYGFIRKLRAPVPQTSAFFGTVAYSQGRALIGAWNAMVPCSIGTCPAGEAWVLEVPAFARGRCFGDACPCANRDPARGCDNSTGRGGGLVACGSASVGSDDLSLRVEHLPPGQPVLLFRAQNLLAGGHGSFWGDGLRCIGGSALRIGVRHTDASGQAAWGPALAATGQWSAGQTLYLQAWYRDPDPSPCAQGFNTTHALEIDFGP